MGAYGTKQMFFIFLSFLVPKICKFWSLDPQMTFGSSEAKVFWLQTHEILPIEDPQMPLGGDLGPHKSPSPFLFWFGYFWLQNMHLGGISGKQIFCFFFCSFGHFLPPKYADFCHWHGLLKSKFYVAFTNIINLS